MLDADLAEIYGYSTKSFNQQVKNNIEKFLRGWLPWRRKDAGNKITTIMQLEDIAGYRTLFEKLLQEGE